MRPDDDQAAAAAFIRRNSMARGAIASTLRFARFKAAKAKSVGDRGAALVEFALIAPMLLLIVLGTAQFGLTLGQFVMLTNAVGVGAMQFAVSRSDTTPYTDTVNAVKAAATTLTPANLTITLSVGSPLTACGNDAACATALTSNVGQPSQVLATYAATFPCNLLTLWQGMASTCNLTSQVTERVQ